MFQNIFNALVRKKPRIIRIFHILWFIISIVYLVAISATITAGHPHKYFWYTQAVSGGRAALILFVITLLPGIFKRFGIRNRILGLIMIFRRQFGITMFLLAAFHATIVSLLPKLLKGPPISFLIFEIFGVLSISLLFFLFITSNDLSQLKMGRWWYALHRLVYIIMWLILFHVALQRLSIWSVLAGSLITAEMIGIAYSHFHGKNSASQLKN